MIFYIPFLIALIGILIYAFAESSKLQEIGKIMFGAGLLAGLLSLR